MEYKNLLKTLGFISKENASDIFIKKYSDDYSIEVDFKKEIFNYGNKIKADNKTTQNFSQAENWVVLECVNRLLEKRYKPENIILEKTWAAGHGTSGRLDICVNRDDGSEYLLIECKTYGKEFDKALSRLNKDGGQLFTYFKFSNKADVIMLYASELKGKELVYENRIIKIEENYRSGDVKDFYEKWNKLTKDNGVFESWVEPYDFESKALTIADLVEIKQEDSSFIFNRFLEILRHNVVSDKGNAFNRIFTLFLCKIYDEKVNEGTSNELGFQWLEGIDDHRSFQLRLTDLYKNGMHEFLEKVVTDFSETEFNNKFSFLSEQQRQPILEEFRKIRLEKNNEFAIKDVYDEQSFNENAVVVKEIVQLLEKYKLRYAKKQQYLSDFFELLLTTGLKQESGQFFTPVPVAQFVIKSLPIDTLVEEKLSSGKIDNDTLLPYVIDYAAGSGHFLTETMHEIQRLIDQKDDKKYHPNIAKKIRNWKDDHFAWAIKYVYGIEKDYRLVKVGKVGCYLHGDGLANVIHSDGLARFAHPDYKGRLLHTDKDFPQDNKQFDLLVSNPPYSVSAFKNAARSFYKNESFELYNSLTDNSSEIETLFVERTKQLLKDGGMAGIILPSSILSNTGIYSKAREIILQYFDIVGITELGSNTFMATGTNTVILFLRRRNNYESIKLKKAVEKFFADLLDVTLNGVEKPVSKYISHVWEGLTFNDYVTLLKKEPNQAVQQHEIYKEYSKKIKAKNEKEFWEIVLQKEQEKLFYFIIAYPQQLVLIKSGEKDAEKRFLGYEFSNRRGSEGIHPIQRGKSIAECTQLFDEDNFENPVKASTYIYKAFKGDFETPIHETLQKNISCHHLVDMLTFNRVEFEKNISTAVKKKVKYETIWETNELVSLSEIADIKKGTSITQEKTKEGKIPVVAGGKEPAYFHNEANRDGNVITISASGAYSGYVNYFSDPIFASDCNTIKSKNEKQISTKLIFHFLKSIQPKIYDLQRGQAQPHVYAEDLATIKIPLPPLDVQKKIVAEIDELEKKEGNAKEKRLEYKRIISNIINNLFKTNSFEEISKVSKVLGGKRIPKESSFSAYKTNYPYIRVSDFINGTINLESLKYIDEHVFNQIKNYTISKDDIYISIAGTIGLVGLVPDELDGKSLTENAAKIVVNTEKISKEFLYNILSSEHVQNQIKDNTRAVGVPKLALKRIETLKIPVPSLSEQQKIVSEIEKIESKIILLEKEIAEIPQQKEAILKKYL
jgi:type I restriction enzyme M protein